MAKKTQKKVVQNKPAARSNTSQPATRRLSEDWLAVIIAAVIILLSVIGLLGKNGINITF